MGGGPYSTFLRERQLVTTVDQVISHMRTKGMLKSETCALQIVDLEVTFFTEAIADLVNLRNVNQAEVAQLEARCVARLTYAGAQFYGSNENVGSVWMRNLFVHHVVPIKLAAEGGAWTMRDEERPDRGQVHINGPVASVNFGTIVGDISQSIGMLKAQDQELHQAVEKLRSTIMESGQSNERKQEMLTQLGHLVAEGQLTPEERKPAIAKAVFQQLRSGLSLVSDVATLLPLLGKLAAYIGITLT